RPLHLTGYGMGSLRSGDGSSPCGSGLGRELTAHDRIDRAEEVIALAVAGPPAREHHERHELVARGADHHALADAGRPAIARLTVEEVELLAHAEALRLALGRSLARLRPGDQLLDHTGRQVTEVVQLHRTGQPQRHVLGGTAAALDLVDHVLGL